MKRLERSMGPGLALFNPAQAIAPLAVFLKVHAAYMPGTAYTAGHDLFKAIFRNICGVQVRRH